MNAAGWYFKTLAAQEAGESNVLMALYGRQDKDTEVFTDFLPFFGTDYGLCSLIKPQVSAETKPMLEQRPGQDCRLEPCYWLGGVRALSVGNRRI